MSKVHKTIKSQINQLAEEKTAQEIHEALSTVQIEPLYYIYDPKVQCYYKGTDSYGYHEWGMDKTKAKIVREDEALQLAEFFQVKVEIFQVLQKID